MTLPMPPDTEPFHRSSDPEEGIGALPSGGSCAGCDEAWTLIEASAPYCRGCPWRSRCRTSECLLWVGERPARAHLDSHTEAGVLMAPVMAL